MGRQTVHDHQHWMQIALQEAHKALDKEEVPIGAIVVCDGEIMGRGHNLVETLQDPSAHAEMLALSAASQKLASWRLEEATLYTTLEPCPMCAGAILISRIPLVVFAARDPRLGACGTAIQVLQSEKLDLKSSVIGGILENKSRDLLKFFFLTLRKR
jgi:tRNA(adenine34) deaminase